VDRRNTEGFNKMAQEEEGKASRRKKSKMLSLPLKKEKDYEKLGRREGLSEKRPPAVTPENFERLNQLESQDEAQGRGKSQIGRKNRPCGSPRRNGNEQLTKVELRNSCY